MDTILWIIITILLGVIIFCGVFIYYLSSIFKDIIEQEKSVQVPGIYVSANEMPEMSHYKKIISFYL